MNTANNIETLYGLGSKYHTTAMKGIAILCVLFGHVANSWGVRWFTPLGGIGVSMFLIMSGYGLTLSYKKKGLQSFWKKRFIGVYIPYAILNIIGVVLDKKTMTEALLSLVLIKPFHAYWWFMQYLLIWYVVFWCVNKLPITEKHKNILFISSAIIFFAVFKKPLWAEQSCSFVIGIFGAKYTVGEKKALTIGILALLAGIFSLGIKQIPIVRSVEGSYIWNFVQLVNKTGVAVGFITLLSYFTRFCLMKPFYWIGIVSFELYLVHAYSIKLIHSQTVGAYMSFVVITAAATVIFYIINRHCSNLLLKVRKK